jgi:hypothetical protein
MLLKAIDFRGRTYSIAHLESRQIKCQCDQIGRGLTIRASFAPHCYTRAFDSNLHTPSDILLYVSPERPCVFCTERYELSTHLPSLIDELPTKKVNQTSAARNYVHVTSITIEKKSCEFYFMLQRAQSQDPVNLRLTVESTYLASRSKPSRSRPNAIRFTVLARKVLLKQAIKFAAR